MKIAVSLFRRPSSISLLCLVLCFQLQVFCSNAATLRDSIVSNKYLTQFTTGLTTLGLLDGLLDDTNQNLTVLAPTDTAMSASNAFQVYKSGESLSVPTWMGHYSSVIRNHILPNVTLDDTQIYDEKILISLDAGNLTVNGFIKTIEGASITQANIVTDNGILHIIDSVIEPLFVDNSLSDLELQPEYGPDYMQRTSLVDVVDFVDARDILSRVDDDGMTSVGCRIRAFNRIDDYILQTINWSKATSIVDAEFLNESWINETIAEFIEYNLLPRNYYLDDISNGYEELATPINSCAHMWITRSTAHNLCFNNACVVRTPNPRTFLASNGVGYVVDKCLVCPGVSMLVTYAANYVASYAMSDMSDFMISSEWNLRNLSESIGDGGPITMFAANSDGWHKLHADDHTRLLTDQWKPHQWDFLRHMVVQGNYTMEAIGLLHDEKGDFNLTSLANQSLLVSRDSDGNLTVADGTFAKADIRGVDGHVHFTTSLPMVRSILMSVYEIAVFMDTFKEQINLIDSVFLYEDLNRLLPVTALYAPDEIWRNQALKVDQIEQILENHIVEELLWCNDLRKKVGQEISTLNGENWLISVNDQGNPCFDSSQDSGNEVLRACITTCDILARNGLVHEVNTIMLQTKLATRGPSPPIPPTFKAPSQPTATGLQQRFPTTPAPAKAQPLGPVSFGRPRKEYSDDAFDDDADDVWSDAKIRKATAIAALLPFVAALL